MIGSSYIHSFEVSDPSEVPRIHLEALVTRFSTLANPTSLLTVEGGANKAKLWPAFAVVWRSKPALAQWVVGRTNSRDIMYLPRQNKSGM